MKREILAVALFAGGLATGAVMAGPTEDLQTYQAYFEQRFPDFTAEDYAGGMYNFNEDKRAQWEAIMEFPPYEMALEEGQELFETPFDNGSTYSSCFENGGIGVAQTYPRFDPESGKVMTLGMAINDCRVKNGEEALDLLKGPLVYIEAYMAETSRGSRSTLRYPMIRGRLRPMRKGSAFILPAAVRAPSPATTATGRPREREFEAMSSVRAGPSG